MATVRASNSSILGILFIVGGALQVIGAIVALTNSGNVSAIYAISNIAIGVGFALMTAWLSPTNLARVAYFIAALGWLLLALAGLINLGPVFTFAVYIAIVGSLFAGVIVISGRPFAGPADILFFCAMIVGAINLLLSQSSNVPSLIEALIIVVFGALLIFAGSLMFRSRVSAERA